MVDYKYSSLFPVFMREPLLGIKKNGKKFIEALEIIIQGLGYSFV